VPATLSVKPPRSPRLDVDDPAGAGDLDLRDRLARKERGAAAELLEQHLDPLYAFVHYRVGRDRSRVEDVVHDTFVVALERIEAYDGRSSLHGWLCGIAKNRIRSERRKRAPVALEDVLADAQADIDAILCDVARERLPDEVMEREETRDLVGATLSALPPEYKKALVEKYVDGLSVVEMSNRSGGKSPKATESTLTRARVAFARVFELLAKKRGGLE
jgi:RNA polymerase sigma-70 factor (ECF subfamily)